MANVQLPSGVTPLVAGRALDSPGAVDLVSIYSGRAQRLERGTERWSGTLTIGPFSLARERALVDEMEVFIADAHAGNTFELPMAAGAVNPFSAAVTVTAISFAGARVAFTLSQSATADKMVKRGDWLGANGRAYRAVEEQAVGSANVIVTPGVLIDAVFPLPAPVNWAPTVRVYAPAARGGGGAIAPRGLDFGGPYRLRWVEAR